MRKDCLTCFRVGDGTACADRGHSAYLYSLADRGVLVDCGEPFSDRLKATGMGFDVFDTLLLSHLHFDHVGGFFMLIQSAWLERRSKPLPVHLPVEGIAPIRQMLRAAAIFDDLLPFDLSFRPLEAGCTVEMNAVRITPFLTTHLEELRRMFQGKYGGDYAAFSFVIESADCRVAHTADIGSAADLDPLLEKPVDLLVCELAHVPLEDVCAVINRHSVRQVVFTHLGRATWERLKETRHRAEALLPNSPCLFVKDGQTVDF